MLCDWYTTIFAAVWDGQKQKESTSAVPDLAAACCRAAMAVRAALMSASLKPILAEEQVFPCPALTQWAGLARRSLLLTAALGLQRNISIRDCVNLH